MNLANLDPKKREQYLLMICGVFFLVALFPIGYYLFGSDVSNMKRRINAARDDIDKLEIKRLAGLNYQQQIKQNAADALPTDNALAAAEYKNWLTTLASASRFEGAQVNNTGTTPIRAKLGRGQTSQQGPDTYYTNFKFSVSGKTTLNDLGRFLQQFYEVKTPHLIRSMTIKPDTSTAQRSNAQRGNQQQGNVQQGNATAQRVDVTMNIEAISIPQTTNKTFEARRKEEDTTDYRGMIATLVNRNFFLPFVPQQPPPPPITPPTVAAASKYTKLIGVTWSNDRGQAWFNFLLEGRQRIFKVGDRFPVGAATCTIEAINPDNTVEVRVESRDRETGEMIREVYALSVTDTFFDGEFLYDLDDLDDEDETPQQTATVSEAEAGSEV